MAIYPTPEQMQSLLAGPADQPVVMVNLLRFKPRADAPDEGISGEEAYRRYAGPMRTFVESGRSLPVDRTRRFAGDRQRRRGLSHDRSRRVPVARGVPGDRHRSAR